MKTRARILACTVAVAVLGAGIWTHAPAPAVQPTTLSFRIGQSFEDVVRASNYAVMQHSNKPRDTADLTGDIFVTEPAVILHFNDPQHGFTLPPTKFAFIGISDNQVVTATTSPMLENLPFDKAVAVLENIQNQFKAGGWQPWETNHSSWFDLSPEGKKRLYARMFEPGVYMQTASLRVPNKYGMTFRLKCAEGCWTHEPPYKFLIDVSVGQDIYGWERGKPLH